jgi:hypothetical protein
MMDLQALANLSQILGAVAVVISVLYLAVQVRLGTRAQRTENYARALDRVATMQALLSQDGDLSKVFSRGVVDVSTLTPQQRIQLTWCLYEAFGAFEFMFHASKTDAIPEEVWKRWSAATAWWLTFPGVLSWWNARPVPFTESFTAYIDALIRENPTDAEAMKRWQGFIGS